MNDPLHQAREHFRAGVEHFEAGRLGEALGHFEAALAFAPQRASVLANLGITLAALGRWVDAIGPLQRATAADPQHSDAWLALGRCRAQLARPHDALDGPGPVEVWIRLMHNGLRGVAGNVKQLAEGVRSDGPRTPSGVVGRDGRA